MYRALLVCNSTFPNDPAELPELHGPSRDGLLLWNTITDPAYGKFSSDAAVVLFEKTSTEIMEHTGAFFGQAGIHDTLLLYYSGHGKRFASQLVLCGRDTSANNLLGTGVSTAILKEMMNTSNAEAIVIILDCCNAGAFKGDISADDLAGIGRYVIAASGAQREAGDARQFGLPSPFTATLIDALKSDDIARGSLDEVYDYILAELPKKLPRPHKNFHGSGVIEIARRPDLGEKAEPAAESSKPESGLSQPVIQQESLGEHGQPPGFPIRPTARRRFDLSYGDLWIWIFYLLLGISSAVLPWSILVSLENWESINDVNNSVSVTTACVSAFIIGTALTIVASVEGVLVSRISENEQSRRGLLEGLQSKGLRIVRRIRNTVAISAGVSALIGMFLGYPGVGFAALVTILAIAALLTILSHLNYGDSAFLSGTIVVGCALFMPQSVSGYNMLNQVSGVGIVQLLAVMAMLLAWYFNAQPAILISLTLFCVVPISLAFATTGYSDGSAIAPFVSICGASFAFLAGLLGNGIAIDGKVDPVTATFLGAAWTRLLSRLR